MVALTNGWKRDLLIGCLGLPRSGPSVLAIITRNAPMVTFWQPVSGPQGDQLYMQIQIFVATPLPGTDLESGGW